MDPVPIPTMPSSAAAAAGDGGAGVAPRFSYPGVKGYDATSARATQKRELPGGVLCIGIFAGDHLAEGRRIDPDGTRYEGHFAAGVLREGSVIFPDGRRYAGSFRADGSLTAGSLHEDESVYTGEFDAQWRRHGQGRDKLANGTVCDGIFEADELATGVVIIPEQPGGRGEVVFRGDLLRGQFVHGELRFAGMVYKGPLQNNNPHGPGGRLELADGSVQDGAFDGGQLHGKGVMVLRNGTVYEGVFEHGRLGSGTVKWPSGDTYEGELDDQLRPQGAGEMFKAAQGHWWRGHWAAGTFSGGGVTDNSGAPVDYRVGGEDGGSSDDVKADFERHLDEEWAERRAALRGGGTPRAEWEAAMRAGGERWLRFAAVWREWDAAGRGGGDPRFVPTHGFDWADPPPPAAGAVERAGAKPETYDEWKAARFVEWRLRALRRERGAEPRAEKEEDDAPN